MEPFVDIGVPVSDMRMLLYMYISLHVEVITLNANRSTDSWNFPGFSFLDLRPF